MQMDFKLDYGPWETIFEGSAYGHDVEIAQNPEHFFIVVVYDKKEGKKVGAVIEGYKAFFAAGQIEAFIQTLPKQCIGIEKNYGEKTGKLFLLSFDPMYVDFKEEDYVRRIDVAIRKTDETSSTIVDLARASSIELKELSVSPKAEYAPILGDPMISRILIGGQKMPELSVIDVSKSASMFEEKVPLLQLGLSKAREIIKESSQNLIRSEVVGKRGERNYAMYILAENLLMENTPVVIFDANDYFDGLSVPTKDAFALKEDLVDFEPFGFPTKQFIAKGTIKVSVKDLDLFFATEVLGMNDPEFQKNISLLSVALRANTPKELAEKILDSKEISEYEKIKAERVLMIIEKRFGELFGEELPAAEMTRTISGRIGRAVIIDVKDLSKDEGIIFVHTIIRQLAKSATQTQKLSCVVIITDADDFFERNKEKALVAIERLTNRGAGVVLGTANDLSEEVEKLMSAKLSIVSEKDVAVSIKGKRNYRVILRPSLSGNPKI